MFDELQLRNYAGFTIEWYLRERRPEQRYIEGI